MRQGKVMWAVSAGACLAGLLTGVARASLLDDLVFAYDMESVAGTTVMDISGNDNHATMSADQTIGTTNPLSFSSQHIVAPGPTGGVLSNALTTNVQLTTATPQLSYSVFVNDNGSSQTRFRLLTSGRSGNRILFDRDGANELRLFHGGTNIRMNPGVPLGSGTWTHYGFVFDAGAVTMYVNGQSIGSGSLGSLTEIAIQPEAWVLFDWPPVDNNQDYIPNASYDEAALWYRALSAAEMEAIYTSGLAAIIPEPASLALLGLGGLLMLGRRRGGTD